MSGCWFCGPSGWRRLWRVSILCVMSDKMRGWLSDREWSSTQLRVPVACVDVLPLSTQTLGGTKVGLIYRETPHQGHRWCLIGGRLFRNESLRAAIVRQIHEVLGARARCVLNVPVQPVLIAEYFSRRLKGHLFDPRHDAVGLTFAVEIRGGIRPMGEALDFKWFDPEELPGSNLFGFGQRKVVLECIRRLDGHGCGLKDRS